MSLPKSIETAGRSKQKYVVFPAYLFSGISKFHVPIFSNLNKKTNKQKNPTYLNTVFFKYSSCLDFIKKYGR